MTTKRTLRSVFAALGVAATLTLTACGASTEKPGSGDTGNAATTSTRAPVTTASAGQSSTESAAPSQSGSSQSGSGQSGAPSQSSGSTAQPQPLNLNLAADPEIAALVPSAVKATGKLRVATDPTYAPNEFIPDGGSTPIGMDVDLATALAQVMGLQVDVQPATFDGILAGIKAGKYDISMSSFTDTKDREQVVNFVNYFTAGTSTMVLKGNPKNINSDADLCGKVVGAENGTTQLDMLTKEDADDSVVKVCKDAGKPAPDAKGYPKQTDVNAALDAGRIDAYLADSPVVAYAVRMTGDKFEKVGQDTGAAPYGIAVPKDPAAMTTTVQKALQKLMDDGSYKKILDNWGVADGALPKATVNAATQG